MLAFALGALFLGIPHIQESAEAALAPKKQPPQDGPAGQDPGWLESPPHPPSQPPPPLDKRDKGCDMQGVYCKNETKADDKGNGNGGEKLRVDGAHSGGGGLKKLAKKAKAMAKITEELAAPCVEAMKEAGYSSNHFDHCPVLAQCIHTTTKFFSCGVGYAFGKAALLLLYMGQEFPDSPHIRFGRCCGSRFVHEYSACAPLVFMRQEIVKTLFTQVYKSKLQRVVSSLWSQLNSPVMMTEARCREAIYNYILQPIQVLLGVDKYKAALEDGEVDSSAQAELDAKLDAKLAETEYAKARVLLEKMDAEIAEAETDDDEPEEEAEAEVTEDNKELFEQYKELAKWWRCSTDRNLGVYKDEKSEECRQTFADAIESSYRLLERAVREVNDDSGSLNPVQVIAVADEIAQVMVDGEPGLAPVPSQPEGVLYACDIYKNAIKHLRKLLEDAEKDGGESLLKVFDGKKPSSYMGKWAAGAESRLVDWEKKKYKRPAKNAKGKVIKPSLRKWKDAERKNPTSWPHSCDSALRTRWGQNRFLVS